MSVNRTEPAMKIVSETNKKYNKNIEKLRLKRHGILQSKLLTKTTRILHGI
jgi:hypothetical protein